MALFYALPFSGLQLTNSIETNHLIQRLCWWKGTWDCSQR